MSTEHDTPTQGLIPDADTTLRPKTDALVQEAHRLVITTDEQYAAAINLGKTLDAMIDAVHTHKVGGRTLDENRDHAHKAWKGWVALISGLVDPMTAAKQITSRKCGDYRMLKERERQRLEHEAQDKIRQQEEDTRLRDAQVLEAQGRVQEAMAVIEQPILTAPVVMPVTTPKIEGSAPRTTWKFRIVNAALVPRYLLIPDEKAIGALVRTRKGAVAIPGVEVYAEHGTSFSG